MSVKVCIVYIQNPQAHWFVLVVTRRWRRSRLLQRFQSLFKGLALPSSPSKRIIQVDRNGTKRDNPRILASGPRRQLGVVPFPHRPQRVVALLFLRGNNQFVSLTSSIVFLTLPPLYILSTENAETPPPCIHCDFDFSI